EPVKGRFTRAASEERELPEAPRLRRLIGPSVILIGVGIASGEYILYPYIASQAGLVFLWAAVVGVLMQFFINMEIERYTLATGETALGGFMRLWKPWGGILAGGAILATMWPGWATSAATIATFAFGGGDPNVIAIAGLLAIGITLTASPVVYQTVEKLQFIKVGAVLVLLAVGLFAVISADAYRGTSEIVTSFGTFPSEIPIAILVGALAAAGAGGANNLVQSNWIRDKGFGMGRYAPRIVSPITGEEEASLSGQLYGFPRDEKNMSRWHEWWRRANLEQFLSFAVIAIVSITTFSLVAYSTVYGNPDLPPESGFDFISLEADALDAQVGNWFGTLFLAIGAVSLFAA
ncbi:MAG: Nramp family divalent metal transporter, partial [Thermoleophilia bacterium]